MTIRTKTDFLEKSAFLRKPVGHFWRIKAGTTGRLTRLLDFASKPVLSRNRTWRMAVFLQLPLSRVFCSFSRNNRNTFVLFCGLSFNLSRGPSMTVIALGAERYNIAIFTLFVLWVALLFVEH